jgi:cell division inhibitor SulA
VVETPLKTLIERFRSKPDWQHADPAVRADAVLRLPSSEREVLLALAREDADPRVRRAAVKKLPDVDVLSGIASSDADPGVRDEAESRLAHLALHERDEAAARAVVAGMREVRHLAAVAKGAPLAATREAAVRALADAKLLASIVRESGDVPTRLLALGRIEDPATLLSLALKIEQKTVAVAAVERLTEADALKAVAAKAKAGAAQRRARARLETGEPATPVVTVAAPTPDDEAERQAYEEARAAHERETEARARAVEARSALVASVEGASGEAIPAAVERAQAERSSLPPFSGTEASSFDARLDAAIEAAGRRHQAYLAGLARREELEALVREAEALEGRELAAARAAFGALESKWRQATADADLPDLRARFEATAHALRSRGQAARAEQAQKEKEHLELLLRLADRAEALVAKGAEVSLRDADHALRDIREALEHPGHFPTRKDRDAAVARLEAARRHLYPLLQQLREDAEWKRWANVSVQEELCAEAEALLGEEDLERAAGALRDLDARWKQAKEAPKENAEALWTRFKAARDQVKSRTDAYFARQAEELAGNLRSREALCERAEALAESTDWLRTAEELRKLQAEWKAVGPVPRAVSQRIWERFRRPCDRFFTRWQEHREQRSHEWADNLARKEALCEQAEALRDSTDWEAASAELKRLQAEWRTIGAVKKSRSEAVWQRFRAACDHFFDRYKNRDEHARQAAQQAREGICADLEGLLPAEGAEPGEPPSDLVARLHAAQTAWRQAGSLPHDQMAALDERFARARDRLVEVFPRAFEGTDLDPEASRRKAEKLALRVEDLLDELAPGGSASRPQTAEELAARLRDALAANTIGGRAAVEAKWHSASAEVEAAQAAWKRLGPVPGAEGQELARRFEQACRRFFEVRPKMERADRPRADRPAGGRGPRPHADRPERR